MEDNQQNEQLKAQLELERKKRKRAQQQAAENLMIGALYGNLGTVYEMEAVNEFVGGGGS